MFKKSIGLLTALCMLLSGSAAMAEMELPTVADRTQITDAAEKQITISDVALTVNDETYTLDPALNLRGYADEESGYAGLSVSLPDNEILPMAFAFNADGLTFSLGNTKNAYHISSEALEDLLGDAGSELGVSGAQILDQYKALLSATTQLYNTPMGPEQSVWMLRDLLANGTGTSSAVNVVINGAGVAGEHWDVRINTQTIWRTYDQWMKDAENPLSAYLQALLDMLNSTMSTDYTGYADVFATLLDTDDDFELTYVGDLAEQGDLLYADFEISLPEQKDIIIEPMHMYLIADGEDMKGKYTFAMTMDDMRCDFNLDFNADENGVQGNYVITGTDEKTSLDFSAVFTADSFATMLSNNTLDMKINVHSNYSNADAIDESETDPYRYTSINDLAFNMLVNNDSKNEMRDGTPLKNLSVAMDFTADDSYSYGYESTGLTEDTRNLAGQFRLDYNEQASSDGAGIVGQFSAEASADDLGSAGLSFNTLTTTSPANDIFADAKIYEVTDEEDTEAEAMFDNDTANMEQDMRTLLQDESIDKLFKGLFGTGSAEMADTLFPTRGGGDDMDAGDDMDDGDDVDDDTIAVSNFDEAARYYNGVIPAYTAPVGYAVSEIIVAKDGNYMTVSYANEAGDEFVIYLDDYALTNSGISYYNLNDNGKLEIQNGKLVTAYVDEKGIGYAYITGAEYTMSFYFHNPINESELAGILGGLKD